MEKAHEDGKPFFVWLNPTRMHIFTHLSPKYKALEGKDNYGLQEAGMAEFDDIIGSVMKKLKDMGVEENTIVMVTTDNGTEVFTWKQTVYRYDKPEHDNYPRLPAITRIYQKQNSHHYRYRRRYV